MLAIFKIISKENYYYFFLFLKEEFFNTDTIEALLHYLYVTTLNEHHSLFPLTVKTIETVRLDVSRRIVNEANRRLGLLLSSE